MTGFVAFVAGFVAGGLLIAFLRRGARPRLDQAEEPLPVIKAIKAERVAMEEVKQNLVQWDLPEFKAVVDLRSGRLTAARSG